MIRHFQLRINIADKDPAVLEPKLRHSLDTITSRHPALRGYTIDPAPAGTLEATLRVSGVHQWAASANARNIATAAVARLVNKRFTRFRRHPAALGTLRRRLPENPERQRGRHRNRSYVAYPTV